MADQHHSPSTGFGDQTRVVRTQERVEDYDVISRHDRAVMQHFTFWMPYKKRADQTRYEQMVPMVFATPRREWAENDLNNDDDRRYTAMEWEGDFAPTQLERISYPSIAVTRLDMTFDQVRWTYTPHRKLLYSNDLNLVMKSNFPLPYNFTYQFDFWVLEQEHLNNMMMQWARKIPSPTWWVDVQYPPPWGEQTVHIQGSPVYSNTSILEGGEQQRELRGVANLTVFGWIPLPTSWVRTVQKLTLEVIEDASEEILEIYETEYANKPEFWDTGDPEQVLEWK